MRAPRPALSTGKKLAFTVILVEVLLVLVEGLLWCLPPARLGFDPRRAGIAPPKEYTEDKVENSHGYHDADHAPSPNDLRVVLLGDSYVEAYTVPVDRGVGPRTEAHLDATLPSRVWAIGRRGWGQAEELSALRAAAEWTQADVVITLWVPFNDVRNNHPGLQDRAMERLKARADIRPGWVKYSPEELPCLLIPASALNRLICRVVHPAPTGVPVDYEVYRTTSDADWDAAWRHTADLIAETRDAATAQGARYGVVSATTPHGVRGTADGLRHLQRAYPDMARDTWDLDLADTRMANTLRQLDVPFLALEPAARTRTDAGEALHWPFDGHWNPTGNDWAGAQIAGFIQSLSAPQSQTTTAE